MNIFNPGALGGLIVGVIICAILAVVGLKVSKKENADIDKIRAGLPEGLEDRLKSVAFTPAEGRNMFSSEALVTSVTEDGDKIKALLLFYAPEHDDFYTRNVKLTPDESQSRNIRVNTFVPVLMKYDSEMHYHDYKKLL